MPESALDRQVFKIKTDESKYRTLRELVLDRVKLRNTTLLKETWIIDDLEHNQTKSRLKTVKMQVRLTTVGKDIGSFTN